LDDATPAFVGVSPSNRVEATYGRHDGRNIRRPCPRRASDPSRDKRRDAHDRVTVSSIIKIEAAKAVPARLHP